MKINNRLGNEMKMIKINNRLVKINENDENI